MRDLTVLGPAIGAGLGIAALVLGKESKTSEFRQAWIDGLRSDIATLLASAFLARGPASEGQRKEARAMNEAAARIRLRFANNDTQAEPLLSSLKELMTSVHLEHSFELVHDHASALTIEAQKVLKSEWKRVKRGEWRYQTVLLSSLIALIYLIYKVFSPQ